MVPPWFTGLFEETCGAEGMGFTVTLTDEEVAEQLLLLFTTTV
jgi:hypothetical protein